MPNQIQLKDAEQDQEIALLKHRVEELEENGVDELRQRVRKLEKTVWSASAVITALITIVGLMDALNAKEMDYGSNGTTQQEVVLQLPSDEINRVVDGDTIDVTIDLGFDLYKKERVRVAGVDTPEKRTRDLEEKELGIEATNWIKEKLDGAISGDDDLVIRTELVGGMGKYGRLLG